MKCSNCLAPLDSTDCFCPSCGKKNPFVSYDAHNKVLFHLHFDDDIEVKEADVPTYTSKSSYPTAPASAARSYSTPLNAQKNAAPAGGQSAPDPKKLTGCVVYLILAVAVLIAFIANLG